MKISNCPFCGSTGKLDGYRQMEFFVWCSKKKCSIMIGPYKTEDGAIRMWNKGVGKDAAVLVKALEHYAKKCSEEGSNISSYEATEALKQFKGEK